MCKLAMLGLTCPKCESKVTINMETGQTTWIVIPDKDKKEYTLLLTVGGNVIYQAIVRGGKE